MSVNVNQSLNKQYIVVLLFAIIYNYDSINTHHLGELSGYNHMMHR